MLGKGRFYTAVVTAFHEDGRLDHQENVSVYKNLMEKGSDGIVLMGSTGEFFNMTLETGKELIDLASDTIRGGMDLIVGTSRMDPYESLELSNYALDRGADGVMIITPYYFPLSEASIEAYYDRIIPCVKGKVYLYNFPGCTGYSLTPELVLKLRRKYDNIAGIKDTIAEFSHTRKLCTAILPEYPDFEIYSGFDEFLFQNIMAGGSGCVGGLSNMAPEIFVEWTRAINAGDLVLAAEYQKKVNILMELFEICTPFLTAVKCAMKLRGILKSECSSRPFVLASELERARIADLLARTGLVV